MAGAHPCTLTDTVSFRSRNLAKVAAGKAGRTELVAFGDPLFSQDEAEEAESMDLSAVKVLAFATHGLVPGELDGLTQPALALSAPAVAGVGGDGLLTMEEILALKLDADWVAGLGHAFFYAGTKALLVTNWSVHSESARELVSDLFKRQANDPKLARSEAL